MNKTTTGFMEIKDNDYKNDLYMRNYGNDVPHQNDLGKRVCLAAIPFLTLHPSFRLPVSLVMTSLRIINSSGSERWRTVAILGITILNNHIGAIFITVDDIVREFGVLHTSKNQWEAFHRVIKISNHMLYLGVRVYGGLELYLLSCAVNASVSFLNSIDEFQNDRWIEGVAEFLMSGVRIHQLSLHWDYLKKVWEIEKILKSINFNSSTAGDQLLPAPRDRSDYGDSTLLSDIFIKRHSGTNFESRPLSRDQIIALIQAARWTPSSYNDQPWNFIFCDRYSHPESYAKVIESIYGQEWVENAPLLVISVVRPQFRYNQKENAWAQYDTGAAALSISLQATELGLMSHQIGGFDPEAIQNGFHLPDGYQPLSIIAIGYEAASLEFKEEELRTRQPYEENFFFGDWGKNDQSPSQQRL